MLIFIAKIIYVIFWTKAIERKNSFLKHFFNLLYVFLQLVNGTPLGEMSQDFWYFIADTIFLSQICSIFLMDQANFSVFNSFTPIVLAILSFLLIRGLSINSADKSRLCLVKTIGKHDAVFLILLYALVVLVLSVIDFFFDSYWAALGAIFFLHALIIFPGLMENKYGVAYVTSLLLVVGMAVLQSFLMHSTPNPYPREKDSNLSLPNELIDKYGQFLTSILPPHKS